MFITKAAATNAVFWRTLWLPW